MSSKKTSIYMAVNVILTFDNIGGEYQDTQEFFDLKIPVNLFIKDFGLLFM